MGLGGAGGNAPNGLGNNGGDGGLCSGGGLTCSGEMSMVNCTVSGNRAVGGMGGSGGTGTFPVIPDGVGGVGGYSNSGGVRYNNGRGGITNCTLVYNFARGGFGGLKPRGGRSMAGEGRSGGFETELNYMCRLASTLVSSNLALNSSSRRTADSDLRGPFESAGRNLVGDATAAQWIGVRPSDQLGGLSGMPILYDPKLSPLQDNGGPTWTHLPLPGSPALDQGRSLLAKDQRGFPRVVDFSGIPNHVDGDGSDIGAAELRPELNYGLRRVGEGMELSFPSFAGVSYRVESRDDLVTGAWVQVGPTLTGTGNVLTVLDSRPVVSERFYRVVLLP